MDLRECLLTSRSWKNSTNAKSHKLPPYFFPISFSFAFLSWKLLQTEGSTEFWKFSINSSLHAEMEVAADSCAQYGGRNSPEGGKWRATSNGMGCGGFVVVPYMPLPKAWALHPAGHFLKEIHLFWSKSKTLHFIFFLINHNLVEKEISPLEMYEISMKIRSLHLLQIHQNLLQPFAWKHPSPHTRKVASPSPPVLPETFQSSVPFPCVSSRVVQAVKNQKKEKIV